MSKLLNTDAGPGVVAVLNQDRADVEAVGVRQTPTFFVNAKPLDPFGEAELGDWSLQNCSQPKLMLDIKENLS